MQRAPADVSLPFGFTILHFVPLVKSANLCIFVTGREKGRKVDKNSALQDIGVIQKEEDSDDEVACVPTATKIIAKRGVRPGK